MKFSMTKPYEPVLKHMFYGKCETSQDAYLNAVPLACAKLKRSGAHRCSCSWSQRQQNRGLRAGHALGFFSPTSRPLFSPPLLAHFAWTAVESQNARTSIGTNTQYPFFPSEAAENDFILALIAGKSLANRRTTRFRHRTTHLLDTRTLSQYRILQFRF